MALVLTRRGEEWVVRVEQARLLAAGQENGAADVQHVAVTQGDGLGYDILSFETSGRERLIEVKTTKNVKETPFYLSRNEIDVSRDPMNITSIAYLTSESGPASSPCPVT